MRAATTYSLLILSSVLVHAGAIAWVYTRAGNVGGHAFQSLDCEEYYQIARNIVQHGQFSQGESMPLTPDTWRTPGYPIFLAGAMLLVGDSPNALIFIQHLLAIGTVLIVCKIASRYMSPIRAGAAAAVFLLEPYHVYYAFWLLSTTVFTFLLVLTWWAWERARDSAKTWHYALTGLLAGFLVLTWPGAILIPIFITIGFVLVHVCSNNQSTRLPNYQIVSVFLFFVLSALTPPLAWMTRNQIVAGHFALSHQSGIVLAYFKATEVELWSQGRTEDRYVETSLDPSRRNSPHTVWEKIDGELVGIMSAQCVVLTSGSADGDPCRLDELTWSNLAQGNKTSHDSFEVSRVLSWIGLRIMAESPFSTFCCGSLRVIENLVFPLNLAIKPARGAQTNRVKAAAMGLGYTLLIAAACVGLIRNRKNWPALYLSIACVLALAITTSPQIDPRFRVPMIPLLAFLALLPPPRAES